MLAFVKPFQPPTKTQILSFRTSTYLGETNHPAAPKVVLTVPTKSLPLTNPELHKFLLLVGPRYDPVNAQIKMSCEKFADRSQNFKWLSDVLDKLINEAKKDPESVKDVYRSHSSPFLLEPTSGASLAAPVVSCAFASVEVISFRRDSYARLRE